MRTRTGNQKIRTMRQTLAVGLAIAWPLGAVACGGADQASDTTAPGVENRWDGMTWDSGEWACHPVVTRGEVA
jgi:hypothetical protein